MMPITAVPQTPAYVRGVINLRGKVIPVVDLRLQFGMRGRSTTPSRPASSWWRSRGPAASMLIGIVVDEVSEVLNIAGERHRGHAGLRGRASDTDFILGMGKMGKGVKILLDIDRVLATDDMAELKAAADLRERNQADQPWQQRVEQQKEKPKCSRT